MSHIDGILKTPLWSPLQPDQLDLDIGLYCMMCAKCDEVSTLLDKNLRTQVQNAFGQYKTANKTEIEKELEKIIGRIDANLTDHLVDPVGQLQIGTQRPDLLRFPAIDKCIEAKRSSRERLGQERRMAFSF